MLGIFIESNKTHSKDIPKSATPDIIRKEEITMSTSLIGTVAMVNTSSDYVTTQNMTPWDNHVLPTTFEWTVIMFISISCVIVNIPVFIVVPRLKNKNIGASTRYTMIHLALTDFLLGLSSTIFRLIQFYDEEAFFKYACEWDGRSNSIIGISSRMIICFFNVDKFLTLTYPFKYKIWMTSCKAMTTLVMIWVAVATYYMIMIIPYFRITVSYFEASHVCLVDYTDNKIFSLLSAVLVLLLPLIASVVSFVGIVRILYKHNKQKKQLKEGQLEQSMDMSPFIMLIVITSFYFMMWIPFFTLNLIWKMMTGHTYSPMAEFATFWLIGGNSVINPFIYLATMKSYQQELLRVTRKLCAFPAKFFCAEKDKHSFEHGEGSDGTHTTSSV